ncbi:MAG: DUF2782 domain-containing protein [Mariprofundus sp.]|nr:DUF2782 domain-containing protein [Mariprofundus sp.]
MRPLFVSVMCALIFLPTRAVAEDAVMPPPSVEQPAGAVVDSAEDVVESAPNLNNELSPPDDDSAVDVRSYQRKDGATVTEYSVRGQIYEIKVQPVGGLPPYYLYRNRAGHFERRRPGGQPFVTPPTWILKKF